LHAALPRKASGAGCTSRSSATIGRASIGRWSRRDALGGVPVPMYQDAPAAEFVYVLNDAGIVYAIARIRNRSTSFSKRSRRSHARAYLFRRSARTSQYDGVTSYDALTKIGREFDAKNPRFFDEEVAKGKAR
jgi:long-chain acyl-CoA synthetase